MTLSVKTSIGLAALLFATTATAQAPAAPAGMPSDAGLAAETLTDGETVRAIALLKAELEEYPGDPALLINLGIAYAQSGNNAEARKSFEAALSNRDMVELETASGDVTDSRRLARLALSMLSRGEFRRASSSADQFTLNEQ